MSTPGIQTTSHTPPTYFLDRTSSSISTTLPDGLNHALNQENIRLQQIVYEHKVSLVTMKTEQSFPFFKFFNIFFNKCCDMPYERSLPLISISQSPAEYAL
jgi:hypothetical protein